MDTLKLEIDGMSCGHCVRAVTEALQKVDGVSVKSVEIGSATVEFDPGATSPDAIADAMRDEGYDAAVAGA